MKTHSEISRPPAASPPLANSGWWDLWFDHRLFLLLIGCHVLSGLVADWGGYADVIRSRTWNPALFGHFLVTALAGSVYVLIWHRLRVHRESAHALALRQGWGEV